MIKLRQYILNGLIAISVAIGFTSCASTKNIPYFQDVPDTAKERLINDAPYKDPLIIKDDILSVTVITIDPTTAAPVNQAASVPVSNSNVGTPQQVPGLLVDKNGEISLPIIGAVKVEGLTTFQAKQLIKKRAGQYYNNPDVQLRFANFKITVIGEVVHPSSFIVPNEKVSVLDALGMAGDLTIYGRRDNVMLIREENGVKQLVRLNLNNSDLFKSPYFYLRQNDVIYVEPSKSKIIQADYSQTRVITIAASVLSAILILLIRLK